MKDKKDINHLSSVNAGKKRIVGLTAIISILLISAGVIITIHWSRNRNIPADSETLAAVSVTPASPYSSTATTPTTTYPATATPEASVTVTPLANPSPIAKPLEHLSEYTDFDWMNTHDFFNTFKISEVWISGEPYYRFCDEARDIEILVDSSEEHASTVKYKGETMNYNMQYLFGAGSNLSFDVTDITGDGEDELIICHSGGGTGCLAGTCEVIDLSSMTLLKIDDYIDALCSKVKVEPIKEIHGGSILCKVTYAKGNVCYGTISAAISDNIKDYSFKPKNYANYYSIGVNYDKHCLQVDIGIDMDDNGNLYLGNITSYMVYDKNENCFVLSDDYTVTMFEPADGYSYDSATAETVESRKEKLLDNIIAIDDRYNRYGIETYAEDYDGDGQQEFIYLLINPGSSKEDIYNYKVDIWFGNKKGVRKIIQGETIDPNTYGIIEVAGRRYFRYDSFSVTSSTTHLLEVRNNQCSEYFTACGGINFSKDSNDFTVTYDCYDMFYDKQEKYYLGHTWKDYYYYADAEGFHEYGAKEISQEEFSKFKNAETIFKDINMKYGNATNSNLQFLKRSNGLIHINISVEDEDRISYYYMTYRINGNNLDEFDTGEGRYCNALTEELAVY